MKKKEFNQKKKKKKKEVFPAKANPKENPSEPTTVMSEHGDWRSTAMVWWFGAAAMAWWFGAAAMAWWFGAAAMVDSLSFSHFDPLFLSLQFSLSN